MICDKCGEVFTPTHGHQKRFCSKLCRQTFHTLAWRKRNPWNIYHQKKRNNLKKYDLTVDTYNSLFEKQNGRCAICKETSKRFLAVDHDHATGEIRGLLCGRCNMALGLLRDNPLIIKAALEYVS